MYSLLCLWELAEKFCSGWWEIQSGHMFQGCHWKTCVSVSALDHSLVCSPCSYYCQLAHVSAYSSELVIDLPGDLCCLILLIITQSRGGSISGLASWSGNSMTGRSGHLTSQWRLCVVLRWNAGGSRAGVNQKKGLFNNAVKTRSGAVSLCWDVEQNIFKW